MRDSMRWVVAATAVAALGACEAEDASGGANVGGAGFEAVDAVVTGEGDVALDPLDGADRLGSKSDGVGGSVGDTGVGGAGGSGADAGGTGGHSGVGGADAGSAGVTDAGGTGGAGGVDGAGAEDAGGAPDVDISGLPSFSFFVTSYESIQELSGSINGFGGDLTFGETGPGAGLRGADAMCAVIAEMSMPGSSAKEWRAFLSVSADESGAQVDAVDRIGDGPWYDRVGRVVASNKANLMNERPTGADAAILNDLPNEWGVPNHQPDPTKAKVDNHDTLTGSNAQGRLFSASATCLDWTSSSGAASSGKPRVGHTWPTSGGGPGGGGPGGGPPGGGPPGGGPGGGDPGGGDGSMSHWISALTEAGCAPGVNLIETGPAAPGATTVGAGGGYGGFYCFALHP